MQFLLHTQHRWHLYRHMLCDDAGVILTNDPSNETAGRFFSHEDILTREITGTFHVICDDTAAKYRRRMARGGKKTC